MPHWHQIFWNWKAKSADFYTFRMYGWNKWKTNQGELHMGHVWVRQRCEPPPSMTFWLSSPPLASSCHKMSGWQHQWNSLQCFWFFAAVEFYLQLWRQHPAHLSLATTWSKTQNCKMLPYPYLDIWIYPEESSSCLCVAGTSVSEAMLWCRLTDDGWRMTDDGSSITILT